MAFSVGGGGGGGASIGGGTGTIGQIAKFTTTTEVDDSHIRENASGISVLPSVGTIDLTTANATGASDSYDINLTAGNAVTGHTGQIILIGGNGSGAGSTGGNIRLYGGNAAADAGGSITLSAGTGTNAGLQGSLNINALQIGWTNETNPTATLTLALPSGLASHTLTWPSAQGAANTLLKNNGSGALAWVTATVPMGGTGVTSATAYAVLCGGTTSTGALQSIASVGTSGQVLTSNGAGLLPTFQTASSISGLTTGTIPKAASATTLNDSLLIQGTNLVEQKSSTTAQTFRVFKNAQATYTTNNRRALVLGDQSASGDLGSGFGSVLSTYAAMDTDYSFGLYDGAGIDRTWRVNTTAGTLVPPAGASIGAWAVAESSVYPNALLNVNLSGYVAWNSNLAVLTLSPAAQPEDGLQIGRVTDEGVIHYGIRSRDASGSNYQMGSFTISAGRATGTAQPTYIRLRGGAQGTASGSTLHTNVDRMVINASKGLSDNTATILAVFTLASGTMSGGIINYLVESSDGTDHQAECGSVVFSFVNKATVYTTGITAHDTQNSASSGTLTVTWSITTGSSLVNIVVNANSSLTPTTLRICYTLQNLGTQAITIS